jgi:hypothetical protein
VYVQHHAFRAKPTLDIAGTAAGSSLGAAGPSGFGPGLAAGQAAEDEQSLTWTSGMARSRQGSHPRADDMVLIIISYAHSVREHRIDWL